MSIDLSLLDGKYDLLFEIQLGVRLGHRFQPTGFPDLGAAEFDTPYGRSLLVESAQSMANRLEAVCWDEGANDVIEPLRGLSHVRVEDAQGAFLTSSMLEAHRINSVYIEKAQPSLHDELRRELGGKDRPIDRRKLAQTLFRYDVGSLLHGVFLESIDGRLRVARAISAFIEADGIRLAASGGVKNDRIQATKDEERGRSAKEGFGNVPFPRDEYTAEKITLYASIDLAQIRGYGLDEEPTRLLILLALFKLRSFVDSPMRLRTACCFELKSRDGIASRNVPEFKLPRYEEFVGDRGEDGRWTGELPRLIRELTESKKGAAVPYGMCVKKVKF